MPPLITNVYTADPSAHAFNGRVYIYPSHDRETDIQFNDNGDQYDMADYHVFSTSSLDPLEPVIDHGVVLKAEDIPWVSKQLWAPDAATKNGKFYLYFPARDKEGIFRIGVAVGNKPEGPFTPEPEPIKGALALTPLGDDKFALAPRVAKLTDDMLQFQGEVQEAAWLYKKDGLYHFSYSTGDTHYLAYATGTSPVGPFTYAGRILEPVLGWTTHHSIVEFNGKWWLFYHDCELSKGVDHLRSVKVKEIKFDAEGKIITMKSD
ncbi:unnamed protein product [Parascedosporium putredinis]|uniref:Uncharacterized protein n=1 Tax=Parascedosporium putredinis TaxID=1442378 RepID=A0A9P1H9B8_9PEZI|nr:unnamed protein product [Parascedosporium putredinis]CAI8001517.1 unnamed protein product [Parascedosporium putredinis]